MIRHFFLLFRILMNQSTKYLNLDLSVISRWPYQWKIICNPDLKKPLHEVSFSRKENEETHPSVFYNNTEVSRTDSQRHLGLVPDNRLTFKKHIKDKLNKAYFGVGKIKRFRDILPRDSLVTIYKSFIRPHLDYGDVIYDQPNNYSFSDKIKQLQYKACLAITGAVQGNVFTMSLNLKVLVAEDGVENFVLSINYCQFNTLSTFSILYHLMKAFMTHARNRDLFSIAELIVSNILSFQILYLNGCNLHQKYKTRNLLQFSKANFSLL